MKQVSIVFTGENETAPLFCQYQNQHKPQPAYVTLCLETGEVDADYSGETGNAVTMDVWHGITRRWSVNPTLSGSQVLELLTELLPRLQTIFEGSEVVHNGNDWVGKLVSDAAIGADELLDRESEYGLWHDVETLLITDLADWLQSGGRDCWTPSPDEKVTEYIAAFDLDGHTTREDIGDVLAKLWAEEVYSGRPIPANVAQYLLDKGTCEGSAWLDELKCYAAGAKE